MPHRDSECVIRVCSASAVDLKAIENVGLPEALHVASCDALFKDDAAVVVPRVPGGTDPHASVALKTVSRGALRQHFEALRSVVKRRCAAVQVPPVLLSSGILHRHTRASPADGGELDARLQA